MDIKLYSPANLELDEVIAKNPFTKGLRLKKDYMTYIVHSIMVQRATKDPEHLKKLGKTGGFVPLKAELLKAKVPTYTNHVDYLIENGIIECDWSYSVGYTSMGYRISAKYVTSDFKRVPINYCVLRRKIFRDREKIARQIKSNKYPYLSKWLYDGKLLIDRSASEQWIAEQEKEALQQLSLQFGMSDEKYISGLVKITEKYRCYRLQVERIASKEFYFHVDDNGHRLHTNLTNLPKGLREFITYDGKQLVVVDIKNSQPYMCLPLLSGDFWQSEGEAGKLSLKKVKMDRRKGEGIGKHTLRYIVMFLDSSERLASIDLQRGKFIQNVVKGTIYEYLVTALEKNGKIDPLLPQIQKREKAKKMVLTLLFDDENKSYNRLKDSAYKLFAKEFPSVARIFSEIKGPNYTNLAILLQRIESYLLLDVVCGKITRDCPEIPLFTIHDSIVTSKGNEQYVEQVMKTELAGIVGSSPTLSFECWKTKNEAQAHFLKIAA